MNFSHTPAPLESSTYGPLPYGWVGPDAPDGDAGDWVKAPIGSMYGQRVSASEFRWFIKQAASGADTDWEVFAGSSGQGFIGIPLESLRELAAGATINAAGNGGLLASDTTPILEKVNGATDGAMRLNWATSNVDVVSFQFTVPPDLDDTKDVYVKVRAAMQGVTDTPTIGVASYWGFGDTAVSDATGAVTGTTVATYTATIAAADIPAEFTCTINLTPGAHGTASHALYVYAIWIEYSKK